MKYLITSASGFGNVGDDLIALVLKGMLENIDSRAEVKLTHPLLVEEAAVNDKLIKWADVVLVGGGGLLYDYDQVQTNLKLYMDFITQAHGLKKPAYVVGIGEQGIITPKGKRMYAKYLNLANLILTRSQQDQQVLTEIGVTAPLFALQDLVFALPLKARRSTSKKPVLRRPRLAFSLPRLTGQGMSLEALGKPTRQLLYRYDEYLGGPAMVKLMKDFDVTLVCQSRDDATWYRQLAERYHVPMVYPDTVETALSIVGAYQKADLVLTGRFHGLILASLLGKPVVAVGLKDQKLHKLIDERLSSLKRSFYSLDKFVRQDLLANLKPLYKTGKLPAPDPVEVAACQKLAKAHQQLLEAALINDFSSRLIKK